MTMKRIADAWLADTARVVGDVTLDADVSVWFGGVVRGDVAPITIGEGSNVQDAAVVHCDHRKSNTIGRFVTIGHGAVVHGREVGDESLIGIHAVVLGDTRIGKRCLIAAGAVVPPGMDVPDETVVMGVPGRAVRPITEAELAYLLDVPRRYVELARRHCDEPTHPDVRPWGM